MQLWGLWQLQAQPDGCVLQLKQGQELRRGECFPVLLLSAVLWSIGGGCCYVVWSADVPADGTFAEVKISLSTPYCTFMEHWRRLLLCRLVC
jgi:hypothetical protein